MSDHDDGTASAANANVNPLGPGTFPNTPSRNRMKRKADGITRDQRQALIDNLQLEITERARKLRAQYALQAQGLRARMEMRLNRIPVAMREMTMGELLAKHEARHAFREAETAAAAAAASQPVTKMAPGLVSDPSPASKARTRLDQDVPPKVGLTRTRGALKRPSDDIDQENVPQPDQSNPKKRAKTTTTTTATTKMATKSTTVAKMAKNRATSRIKTKPSQVLSPKSHNSRTGPSHSPIRLHVDHLGPSTRTDPNAAMAAAAAATSTLASAVERAKRTRAATATKVASTAKDGVEMGISLTHDTATMPPPPPSRAETRRRGAVAAASSRIPSNQSVLSTATTGTVITRNKVTKTRAQAKASEAANHPPAITNPMATVASRRAPAISAAAAAAATVAAPAGGRRKATSTRKTTATKSTVGKTATMKTTAAKMTAKTASVIDEDSAPIPRRTLRKRL